MKDIIKRYENSVIALLQQLVSEFGAHNEENGLVVVATIHEKQEGVSIVISAPEASIETVHYAELVNVNFKALMDAALEQSSEGDADRQEELNL